MQYKQAYLDAREAFAKADPSSMADQSGAFYDQTAGILRLTYCGCVCTVTHPGGDISVAGWPGVTAEEKIIILQYLHGASGLPARNRWLSFLELPGGPHHYAPFQKEALFPLAKRFGMNPEGFGEAAAALGGQKASLGKVGIIIPALPKISLGLVLWPGDDEFPAAANILFDEVATTYLATSSLYMLGIAVAQRMLAYPGLPSTNWYDVIKDHE